MEKICRLLHKYAWIAYSVLGIPVLAGLIFLFAGKFLILPFHFSVSQAQLVLLPPAEILFLLVLIQISCSLQSGKTRQSVWLLVLIFSLTNLILALLLRGFYDKPGFSDYPSVQLLLKLSIVVIVLLSLAIVVALLKLFWVQALSLWNQFSFEKEPENRRFTFIFLAACFIIGISLRLININQLPPYVDEYVNPGAALKLLQGEQTSYLRALVTVTLPLLISYKIFGVSIWASRLPMVLINMAAIFPLFFLTKKINRTVGYLSVVLFILNPWLIGAAKTIREYAVAPMVFYVTALLLIDLLNWDDTGLIPYLKKNKFRLMILVVILAYTIYDRLSVLKINIAIFGCFILLVAIKYLRQRKLTLVKTLILGTGLSVIALLIGQSRIGSRFIPDSAFLQWNPGYFNVLIDGTYQQWYSFSILGYLILIVGAYIAVRIFYDNRYSSNHVFSYCFLIFITFLLSLSLSIADAGFRYGVLIQYWYLILTAVFLYQLYKLINQVAKHKPLQIFLSLMIFLGLFTNFRAIHQAITYTGGGESQVTHETHPRISPALDYLLENINRNDILLTDTLHKYGEIVGKPLTGIEIVNVEIFRRTEEISALDYVNNHPSGWIAVTQRARAWLTNIPDTDFKTNGISVIFLGTMGDVSLWRWGKPGK